MIRCFSKTGNLHTGRQEENQDAILSGENGRFLALVLADGVSSCQEAGPGARVACRTAADLLLTQGTRFLMCRGRQAATMLLPQILAALTALAEEDGVPLEEYSSTIACVLLDRVEGKAAYCSVGDSLILAAGENGCRVLAMPDSHRDGCCVTTTRGAAQQARAGSFDVGDYHSILLCSDGAWRLMYDKNRLAPPVRHMLLCGNYGGLSYYLNGRESQDDCTFICHVSQ